MIPFLAVSARPTVLLIVLLGATAGRAVLWESPRWAAVGSCEAGTGYDSNLFARAGSPDDGYLLATPAVELRRLNSLTRFLLRAEVRTYSFLDHQDLNSTDPALQLQLRYPANSDVLATQELDLSASRRTEVNADVGGRLRREDWGLHWEGSYQVTGKVALQPRLSAGRTDYLTTGYNTNDTASAGFTVAYAARERLQLGAGYDFEWSRSEPDRTGGETTRGRRHAFTLRGRGELLPKVTGYAYAGISRNDYRGGLDRRSWELVANVSLAWQATARGSLIVRLNRTPYFSADGSSTTIADVGLEWQQEFARGFFAAIGASTGSADFRSLHRPRSVDRRGAYVELRYTLTERFHAGLKVAFADQSSADPLEDYDRTTILLAGTLRF